MPATKRPRKYAVRKDSTIASFKREIAKRYDLPEDCIQFVRPGGKRKVKTTVGALLKAWDL